MPKKRGRWYLVAGGILVGAILFVALFAEQLTSVSPHYYFTKENILQGTAPFPPGPGMPLGTDQLGRDVWSRIAFGARWSLLFAFLIMGCRMLLALPVALLCTFGSRWWGRLLSRLYVYTSAVPPLLVYLLLLTSPGFRLVGLVKSLMVTVMLLTVMEWPRIAVLLRGRMEAISLEPFIEGAVAVGATRSQIFWTHMVPHLWPTLMQVMTAEMGRALMNIAQLGFFGVWVGGGLLDVDYSESGKATYKVTVSVPEWGTLLAGAREYIRTAPWIPIAPATAFFTGILGFNLLSQGLDQAIVSVARLRVRLTGRVRWAVPALAAATVIGGVLLYHHGLPWGHGEEIMALAHYQKESIQANKVDQYLETLLDKPGLRADHRGWLEAVPRDDLESVMVFPSQVKVAGGEARALWTIVIGFRHSPPLVYEHSVNLVRRGQAWYDAGEALTDYRGQYATVRAFFDPVDPSLAAADARYRVNLTASVADHAYLQALASVPRPAAADQRLMVALYPSHLVYSNVVRGLGAPIDPDRAPMWLGPDQVLHVSWDVVKKVNREPMQQAVAFEVLKILMARGDSGLVLPLLTGTMEIKSHSPNPFELFISQLTGTQFYELEELCAARPETLDQAERPVYTAQSALLVEFLETKLPQDRLQALVRQEKGDVLGTLARELGLTGPQLSAQYRQYVFDRLAERSVLNLPGGKARVPAELAAAIQGRSEAPGALKYKATLLDVDTSRGTQRVTLLEQYTLADGSVAMGITVQDWLWVEENWTPGPAIITWSPERRHP